MTPDDAVNRFFWAWYLGHVGWAKWEQRTAQALRYDYEQQKLLLKGNQDK